MATSCIGLFSLSNFALGHFNCCSDNITSFTDLYLPLPILLVSPNVLPCTVHTTSHQTFAHCLPALVKASYLPRLHHGLALLHARAHSSVTTDTDKPILLSLHVYLPAIAPRSCPASVTTGCFCVTLISNDQLIRLFLFHNKQI